jgi:SAM-dependent methyltransferase
VIDQRALRAWAGTDRLSALDPARLAALPLTRGSAELALFVAGVDAAAALVEHPLAQARVAILPTARGVIVCDRHDAPDTLDRVCWPDDSSYHLVKSIPPGRRTTWLDLGCGSAFAMLERPELADRLVAVDLNARAVDHARLGAKLSGLDRLEVICADATTFDPGEQFELVTCNVPMPGVGGPMWRGADPDVVRGMLARAAALVAPGGLLVAHSAVPDLAGTSVAYAPGFAVTWWSPGDLHHVRGYRALTPDRPHLDDTDRQL